LSGDFLTREHQGNRAHLMPNQCAVARSICYDCCMGPSVSALPLYVVASPMIALGGVFGLEKLFAGHDVYFR
jgi:hypothetical protein